MKTTPFILAALMMAAPLCVNSCSVVNQVRSVDMSKIPGLNAVADAQKDMMAQYGTSARLLLQSRMAALEALALDAEAYADAKKAGEAYDKAVTIAKNARAKMAAVNEELTNIQNSPDLGALNKAVDNTKDAEDMVNKGYTELASIAGNANAAITAQNNKGDKLNLAAVQHVEAANVKIAESYGLLQDARWEEAKLVGVAAVQSAALVKSMKDASPMDKAALAITFRPIVYFVTGLPGEFEEQGAIMDMWEEHAKQVAGLKLPSRKQLPDVKAVAAKAAPQLASTFTPSVGSFFNFNN